MSIDNLTKQADGSGVLGYGLGQTGPVTLPPKFYRIGEVMQYSGFSRQTIHNYTVMGLISESEWTDGGHRLYDADVFERLAAIKGLKGRYSLRQIKQMLAQVATEQTPSL